MTRSYGSLPRATARAHPLKTRTNELQKQQFVPMRSASYDSAPLRKPSTRRRYDLAERALAATIRSQPAEASPQELQIRTLKRATQLLSLHAEDARERAQVLRLRLAERTADPPTFTAMQRERWMEERREAAVTHDAALVKKHVNRLVSGNGVDDTVVSASEATESRRQTNLHNFLRTSQTHKPFRRRGHRTVASQPLRRMDEARLSALQLRTNLDTRQLFLRAHRQSINQRETSHSMTHPSLLRSSKHTMDMLLEADDESSQGDETHICDDSPPTSPEDSVVSLSPLTPSQPLIHSIDSIVPPSDKPSDKPCRNSVPRRSFDSVRGTAVIYPPLSSLALPADPADDTPIALPEYAQILLDEFAVTKSIELPLSPAPPSATPSTSFTSSPRAPSVQWRPVQAARTPSKRHSSRPSALTSPKSLFIIPEAISSRFSFVNEPSARFDRPKTSAGASQVDLGFAEGCDDPLSPRSGGPVRRASWAVRLKQRIRPRTRV
ncbi:hypothetical protein HGRIS_000917 [Hohenbuehelia grisea]|uniref:Uncharacterized protein n=1 Tax=Hohenbuehelia grisea TaxID=104357 RepID=A0ABR3IQ56_9AGAR